MSDTPPASRNWCAKKQAPTFPSDPPATLMNADMAKVCPLAAAICVSNASLWLLGDVGSALKADINIVDSELGSGTKN